MRTTLVILLVLPLAIGFTPARSTGEPPTEPPGSSVSEESRVAIPDFRLGLHKESIFEVFPPPRVPYNTSDPGERPLPTRPSIAWPPVIPHAIADFLPITRTDNMCIDCHQLDVTEAGEPTPIPQSHFVDLRNAPEAVGQMIAGSRWICVSCHLSQTDAEPLVANSAAASDGR